MAVLVLTLLREACARARRSILPDQKAAWLALTERSPAVVFLEPPPPKAFFNSEPGRIAQFCLEVALHQI